MLLLLLLLLPSSARFAFLATVVVVVSRRRETRWFVAAAKEGAYRTGTIPITHPSTSTRQPPPAQTLTHSLTHNTRRTRPCWAC
jgi:hypothetical protein